jgi:hypothetical protein
VNLSNKERDLLLDILDRTLEEMDDAKQDMIDDTYTLSNFDDFTSTFQMHDRNRLIVESIKQKVENYNGGPGRRNSASGIVRSLRHRLSSYARRSEDGRTALP